MGQDAVVIELLNRVIALENNNRELEARIKQLEDRWSVFKTNISKNGPKLSKKYLPITNYLLEQDKDEIKLTFAEIEKLIGTKLPDSAWNHQAFWANTDTHSIALSWMGAGFEVDHADRTAEEIVFKRVSAPDANMINIKLDEPDMEDNQ